MLDSMIEKCTLKVVISLRGYENDNLRHYFRRKFDRVSASTLFVLIVYPKPFKVTILNLVNFDVS
jgi:hypothetical protein